VIIRSDETWTTIQCKNLVGDNGEICDLCFKVLNDRFAFTQRCPYCLGEIDLRASLKIDDQAAFNPNKTVYRPTVAKRHFIKED